MHYEFRFTLADTSAPVTHTVTARGASEAEAVGEAVGILTERIGRFSFSRLESRQLGHRRNPTVLRNARRPARRAS